MMHNQVNVIEDLFNIQTGWDATQYPHLNLILQKYGGGRYE